MVVNIWVSIPCTVGALFRLINEKFGAETGDLAVTYKLIFAAVGFCRHAVRISGGFSWVWSNGNELLGLGGCEEYLREARPQLWEKCVDREGGVCAFKPEWFICCFVTISFERLQ